MGVQRLGVKRPERVKQLLEYETGPLPREKKERVLACRLYFQINEKKQLHKLTVTYMPYVPEFSGIVLDLDLRPGKCPGCKKCPGNKKNEKENITQLKLTKLR